MMSLGLHSDKGLDEHTPSIVFVESAVFMKVFIC